jgi:hypothetical protein
VIYPLKRLDTPHSQREARVHRSWASLLWDRASRPLSHGFRAFRSAPTSFVKERTMYFIGFAFALRDSVRRLRHDEQGEDHHKEPTHGISRPTRPA